MAGVIMGDEAPFRPEFFLSKSEGERIVKKYRVREPIYMQGEQAESLFYLQSGKIKITVISELGKEAGCWRSLGLATFSARDCCRSAKADGHKHRHG